MLIHQSFKNSPCPLEYLSVYSFFPSAPLLFSLVSIISLVCSTYTVYLLSSSLFSTPFHRITPQHTQFSLWLLITLCPSPFQTRWREFEKENWPQWKKRL
ncbi:hypothetical protein ILYODFUR_027413 [Ilyodon furcidens]|uniref:Uncharacterized protein n=1 Tax=Ilyodon furcidens TaxID=33524 RepID=A0ABV0UVS0_9TELE